MVRTTGGEHYAANILQLAAERMGSQTQLVDNNPGHNSYVLDSITANVWYLKHHYDNAEKKYKEALLDIENTAFPSEEEKYIEISKVYDDLSGIYDASSQFTHAIAYQNGAIATGGEVYNDSRFISCVGYYSLKYYAEAVKDCSKWVENGDDNQARFWWAKSYRALKQTDAALQDYEVLANSPHTGAYRSSSAIEISVLYAERNDIAGMLAVLEKKFIPV